MPQNGEINTRFGSTRTSVVGRRNGHSCRVTFPDCATHIRLTSYRQFCAEIVSFISQSSVGIATGSLPRQHHGNVSSGITAFRFTALPG